MSIWYFFPLLFFFINYLKIGYENAFMHQKQGENATEKGSINDLKIIRLEETISSLQNELRHEKGGLSFILIIGRRKGKHECLCFKAKPQ